MAGYTHIIQFGKRINCDSELGKENINHDV